MSISVISCEKALIPPLISLTSPRETNVQTIFFPPMRQLTKKRSAGKIEDLLHGDVKSTNAKVAGSIRNVQTAALSRVKPNNRQIDPGQFYMDHFVSNKENRDQCFYRNKHVTIARKPPSRENTTHVREHVSAISENMSGSKAQIKKVREPVTVRGKKPSEKQTFSSVKTQVRDKKLLPDKGSTTVHELRSAKLTPKETISRHAVSGKELSKSTAAKPEEKKSRADSLPHVEKSHNQPLLHLAENGNREARAWRLSPRSLLEQISEESSTNEAKRGISRSGTQPKGLGSAKKVSTPVDRTRTPGKASPNNVSLARKKNDKSSRGASVEDRVQEMALPKVTINEVLQSWNIGPQRTRSSSLAGKDPMEFLRRDRSLSDPKDRPTSYEELRRCRYLRTDKDQGMHEKFCSCNSCEHVEGLKNTPYLNS